MALCYAGFSAEQGYAQFMLSVRSSGDSKINSSTVCCRRFVNLVRGNWVKPGWAIMVRWVHRGTWGQLLFAERSLGARLTMVEMNTRNQC